MSRLKVFDQRFGKHGHLALPAQPGIYRFYDEADRLIYVGKAKNLRRRLSQYRNAKRRRAHVKMQKIVKEAVRLDYEICESEFHALALETDWIQKHRPKWNVAGAFYFLYPMVGVRIEEGQLYLCYTTTPEYYPDFRFHGAFRSRERTKEAFFALVELLRLIGHPIPKNHMAKAGVEAQGKSNYVYGYRQMPEEWLARLDGFLSGEAFTAIEELALLLIERPSALARRKEIQDELHALRRFWRHEILALKRARKHSDWKTYPVQQKDRDLIFIALRSRGIFSFEESSGEQQESATPVVLRLPRTSSR